MKYYELDEEEKEILNAYEKGKIKSVPNVKQGRIQYKTYAKASLEKTKNINIRISESDLLKIKALAIKEGIPYQTLISSIIHRHSKRS
jgi:predicted DNA binding CopG/RHH family protein